MAGSQHAVGVSALAQRIHLLRGQEVMLDADLAELYGVPTRTLNQAVKRNAERFAADFMFQLHSDEHAAEITNCDLKRRPRRSPHRAVRVRTRAQTLRPTIKRSRG